MGDHNRDEEEKDQQLAATLANAAEAVNNANSPFDRMASDTINKMVNSDVSKYTATIIDNTVKGVEKAIDNYQFGDISKGVIGTGEAIGKGWLTSVTDSNPLATALLGDSKLPSPDDIAAAQKDIDRYTLTPEQAKELGIPTVAKEGLHASTALPICTSNAAVRCSFGVAFGQLTVFPINRVCIGQFKAPVATITDCLPNNTNIPQFGLCFNILNPAVAIATAIATAAKGGVFTLTPMPCFGTMAPTPWIPTTKNMCGGKLVVTQSSCSMCWGIGSISILHCGQGLAPGSISWYKGPDWESTIKGWAESICNIAGGVGALTGVLSKGAKMSKLITLQRLQKIQKTGNKLLDIADYAGNTVNAVISAHQGDMGGAASAATSIGTKILGNKLHAKRAPKRQETAHKKQQTAQERLGTIQQNETNALSRESQKFNQYNDDTIALGRQKEKQATLETTITNKKAEQKTAEQKHKEAQQRKKQADQHYEDAQATATQREQDLRRAEKAQAKKTEELESAKREQGAKQQEYDSAKERQKQCDADLQKKQELQRQKEEELKAAEENRNNVYNDPNATPEQKVAADEGLTNAQFNKAEADMDVSIAKHEKAVADLDLETKKVAKVEADENLTNAQFNKAEADMDVSIAKHEKDVADLDLETKKVAKVEADENLTNAQFNKAEADMDVSIAKHEKATTDQKVKEAEQKQRQSEKEWHDAQHDVAKEQKAAEKAQKEIDRQQQRIENPNDYQSGGEIAASALKNPALKVEADTINKLTKPDQEEDFSQYVDYYWKQKKDK